MQCHCRTCCMKSHPVTSTATASLCWPSGTFGKWNEELPGLGRNISRLLRLSSLSFPQPAATRLVVLRNRDLRQGQGFFQGKCQGTSASLASNYPKNISNNVALSIHSRTLVLVAVMESEYSKCTRTLTFCSFCAEIGGGYGNMARLVGKAYGFRSLN